MSVRLGVLGAWVAMLLACGGDVAENRPNPQGVAENTEVDPVPPPPPELPPAPAAPAPGVPLAVEADPAPVAETLPPPAVALPGTAPQPAPPPPPPSGAPVAVPPPPAEAAAAAPAPESAPPVPAAPPPRGPTTYRLNPGKSWIYAVLKYDRDTLIAGHDHVIKATDFDGTVVWSPVDPAACKVDISFPVTALKVDPPGGRARAGLEGDTPSNDVPKIEENMLGKSQLAASSFPRISFTSTKCDGTSGSVKVSGNLTIHGVSKSVTVTMDVSEDGGTFAAKGSLSVTHTMFGFSPFTAALGALKNDDKLKLVIDVKGAP